MATPATCKQPPGTEAKKLGRVMSYDSTSGRTTVALVAGLKVDQCVEIAAGTSGWLQRVPRIWLGGKSVSQGQPGETVQFEVRRPTGPGNEVRGFVPTKGGPGPGGAGAGGGGGVGVGGGGGGGTGSSKKRKRARGGG